MTTMLALRRSCSVLASASLALAWACGGGGGGNPLENTPDLCQDGEDNDLDRLSDCDDPDCQVFTVCRSGSGDADGGPDAAEPDADPDMPEVDADPELDAIPDSDEDIEVTPDADEMPDGDEVDEPPIPDADEERVVPCPDGCDDGHPCTRDECFDGVCVNAPDDNRCDDDDECTVDTCNPTTFECEHAGLDTDGDGFVDEACGGTDCEDGNGDIRPNAPETSDEVRCDRIDQDCDDVPDDGLCCAGLGEDQRMVDLDHSSDDPDAAFSGALYGFAWVDDREPGTTQVYFGLTDPDLDRAAGDLLLSDGSSRASAPHMAWADTDALFGVAWSDARNGTTEVYYQAVSEESELVGDPVRVTDDALSSTVLDMEWNGAAFAVLYEQGYAPDLYVAHLDPDGTVLDPGATVITSTGILGNADLVWADGEYALVWTDWNTSAPSVYTRTVSADLATLSEPLQVNSDLETARDASGAWTGSELVIAWSDRRDGTAEIYFNAVAEGARLCTTDVRVTYEIGTSVAPALHPSAGDVVTAVWVDSLESRNALHASALSGALCEAVSEEAVVFAGDPSRPCMCGGLSTPAVFWGDGRHPPETVVYADLVGCVPEVTGPMD